MKETQNNIPKTDNWLPGERAIVYIDLLTETSIDGQVFLLEKLKSLHSLLEYWTVCFFLTIT